MFLLYSENHPEIEEGWEGAIFLESFVRLYSDAQDTDMNIKGLSILLCVVGRWGNPLGTATALEQVKICFSCFSP